MAMSNIWNDLEHILTFVHNHIALQQSKKLHLRTPHMWHYVFMQLLSEFVYTLSFSRIHKIIYVSLLLCITFFPSTNTIWQMIISKSMWVETRVKRDSSPSPCVSLYTLRGSRSWNARWCNKSLSIWQSPHRHRHTLSQIHRGKQSLQSGQCGSHAKAKTQRRQLGGQVTLRKTDGWTEVERGQRMKEREIEKERESLTSKTHWGSN